MNADGSWMIVDGRIGRPGGEQDTGTSFDLIAVIAPTVGSVFTEFISNGQHGGFDAIPDDCTVLTSVQVIRE